MAPTKTDATAMPHVSAGTLFDSGSVDAMLFDGDAVGNHSGDEDYGEAGQCHLVSFVLGGCFNVWNGRILHRIWKLCGVGVSCRLRSRVEGRTHIVEHISVHLRSTRCIAHLFTCSGQVFFSSVVHSLLSS